MGLAMAEVIARVPVRCWLISQSNSGEGRLDSSVPLFFSYSRPLSRSSERDARIERLLTNVTVYAKTRHLVRKIFFEFSRSTAKLTFLTLS